MSKQPYNPQLLRDYLLGVLREAEVERLDELSFKDDEFAAALSAAEKDLVDAYVQNELTSEELERFRSHYLASHPGRQKAQFAEALKTIMERESMQSRVVPAVIDKPTSQKAFDMSLLWTTLAAQSITRWALVAAVVALVVISVWLGVQNDRLRQQVATTQSQLHELQERERELSKAGQDQRASNAQDPIQKSENVPRSNETEQQPNNNLREPFKPGQGSIASFILTPQLRSAGAVTVVSLPPDTLNVRMNLKLEPNDYQSYKVALVDPDSNQILWQSGKLNKQRRGGDTIAVNLSAVLLKPKTYLLHLFGTASDGASEFITQYPFRVVRQ